jgi:hypothetical protein
MSISMKSQGGDQRVMKARCRCLTKILSVELAAPSCAKGGPNRDTLLEARHQLLIERHYADTRRPFADIRQHCSASWRIIVSEIFRPSTFTSIKGDMPAKQPPRILTPRTLL